jgi:asparagine synthase (glutamine-hydrolysing)
MPGLVGLITKMPREEAERELRQMVAVLCHERFYATGVWIEDSLGVYVGWAARKDSFSDGMPLRNERGDVVLVFSGEEFPEPGTSQGLKARGHDLDLTGPSYLVHRYEEEQDFPARLNGRFHGLVADISRGMTLLFNDRYAMKRLYCHQSKEALYFAAEAKAILAVRPELRRLDPRGLGEFVACGAVLENRTLFDGIELLPLASAWTFRNGTLERKSSYFQPKEWEESEPLDSDSFRRELTEVFERNLPRYFAGQERLGMSLTGGLDTRMIMAWQQCQPRSLPCYTFGSIMRENQDVRVARRVADACKQPFHVISAGQEFLSRFSHYAQRAVYLSDGCADVSRAPDIYLNEKAREIAPVRMTGNYGGEILRQVRTFKPVEPLPGLFDPGLVANVHEAARTFSRLSQGNPVSFAAFKQNPWNHYGILALEEAHLSLRSPFLDNDLVRTAVRAPLSAITGNEASLYLISKGKKELLGIPTDRGLAGERGTLAGAAHRGLLEFQFKAEYAYDLGMPQWLARADHAFSALRLQRLFLGRHKVFHFRIWYRDALAGYVRDMLLDPLSLSRPYIERKRLEEIVCGHLRGDRNYTNEIHKVLTLELLARLLLDPPTAGRMPGVSRDVSVAANAPY